MRALYQEIYDAIDVQKAYSQVAELTALELGQTSDNYHAAAQKVAAWLRQEGIPQVQELSFPADGKTVYHDKCMPLAWKASVGRLTLLDTTPPEMMPAVHAQRRTQSQPLELVVADYQFHPLQLIKGSVAPNKSGSVETKVLTEAQVMAGESPQGCMVMLEPMTRPTASVLTPLLDLGAIGLISDYLVGRYETPDCWQWVAACTEGPNWHVGLDDRNFVGFSVSPQIGDLIRAQARTRRLRARVECDGRRLVGTIPAVTALLPGERQEEVWMLAHLFEPLANDNSAGVITVLEGARVLGRRCRPYFSIRLVLAMELYGFAAYAASRGSNLAAEVIGAVNCDAVLTGKGREAIIQLPGAASPSYSCCLAELLVEQLNGMNNAPTFAFDRHDCRYHDDMALSDATVGVPTLWPRSKSDGCWHNSVQTVERIDPQTYRQGIALNTTIMAAMATPKPEWLARATKKAEQNLKEELENTAKFTDQQSFFQFCWQREKDRLQDFSRCLESGAVAQAVAELDLVGKKLMDKVPIGGIVSSPWRDYAASMVLERATVGFPQDMVLAPKRMRRRLNSGLLYSPLSHVLAAMDGKADLASLIRQAEYEVGSELNEKTVKSLITTVCGQADYGYLRMLQCPSLDEATLVAALRQVGVQPGDLLLVHSSLSACGHIQGGASTVIKALRTAVGDEGTVLFPTFTRSFIMLGENVNRSYSYRPFDPVDPEQVWTGEIPRALLRENVSGLVRSQHVTHSWAGFGALAEQCLRPHAFDEPPASETSPMAVARQLSGRILYFGCSLNATTYLHALEHASKVPFLGPAVCRRKNADGSLQTVFIPQHLPGHRDFYRQQQPEKSKFFRRALQAGLSIRHTQLGMGQLQLLELNQLDQVGSKLLQDDPRVMLCDDPKCEFCSKY